MIVFVLDDEDNVRLVKVNDIDLVDMVTYKGIININEIYVDVIV